jgi:hypothetical protein
VRECVTDWRDRIYDRPDLDDAHYLLFTPYDPKVHESARLTMLTPTPTPAMTPVMTPVGSGPSSQQSLQEEQHFPVRRLTLLEECCH